MGFAERTFIVLDKQMVAGDFVPGDPHVEGQCHFWLLVFFVRWIFLQLRIYGTRFAGLMGSHGVLIFLRAELQFHIFLGRF